MRDDEFSRWMTLGHPAGIFAPTLKNKNDYPHGFQHFALRTVLLCLKFY